MELPGGAPGSYQDGQTNAETVVNITWGDDVQPVVDGTYALINKSNLKLLDNDNGSSPHPLIPQAKSRCNGM